jgi:hypothetical protein
MFDNVAAINLNAMFDNLPCLMHDAQFAWNEWSFISRCHATSLVDA